MRLYLSPKEAKLVKEGLLLFALNETDYDKEARIHTVIERISICEELQDNERRSKNDAE